MASPCETFQSLSHPYQWLRHDRWRMAARIPANADELFSGTWHLAGGGARNRLRRRLPAAPPPVPLPLWPSPSLITMAVTSTPRVVVVVTSVAVAVLSLHLAAAALKRTSAPGRGPAAAAAVGRSRLPTRARPPAHPTGHCCRRHRHVGAPSLVASLIAAAAIHLPPPLPFHGYPRGPP